MDFHRMFRVLTAAALSLLAACASSVESGYDPAQHPGSGVALVSVTQTRGTFLARGAATFFQFDREGPGQTYTVTTAPWNLEDDAAQVVGRLYALEMPVGSHRLSTWWMDNGAGLEVHPRGRPPALTFEITGGTVTYLGNLHSILRSGRNLLGLDVVNGASPVIENLAARDIPLAERMYPKFADRIVVQLLPTGPWGADETSRQINPSFVAPVPAPRR